MLQFSEVKEIATPRNCYVQKAKALKILSLSAMHIARDQQSTRASRQFEQKLLSIKNKKKDK